MINNIEEDYCSFEIAKLLKEKKFDVNTLFYYWESGDIGNGYVGKLGSYDGCYNLAKFDYPKDNICAMPTHALAIKWILENFGIHIWVDYDNKLKHYCGNYMTINKSDNNWINKNSFEEATEAALLFTLQNLIC